MKIDVKKIEGTLERLRRETGTLPFPVRSWRVETGLDSTDDPAIWIWITLENDDAFAQENRDRRIELGDTISDRVRDESGVDDEYWIYVRFEGDSPGIAA